MNSNELHLRRPVLARITGALYLGFVMALALADVFGSVGVADAEKTYEVATTDPTGSTIGLVFGLLSAFLFVMAAWGLYVLLAPINRDLALLFLVLNAIGVAIQVASYFPVVLVVLSAGGFGADGDSAMAAVDGLRHIQVHEIGFATAQLFFGTWLFPLGYLVYRSGRLPRFLGVLLVLDGVAVLLWFFQAMLLPDNPAISTPGLALSFIAEVGLGLWLLAKGIDDGVALQSPG